MASNNWISSDLPRIHNVVQNAMTLYPKELVIQTLRDYFSQDSQYHYVRDHWGFSLTPDHTDLPLTAGYHDDTTTRLFIGEKYRTGVIYYPDVLVASGGSTSVPISFNMELSSVKWAPQAYEDGYGNVKQFSFPSYHIFAGAWEGTITIDVRARDLRTRDELVDIISLMFVNVAFYDLERAGLIVKAGGVSAGAPTEQDDRNDKLFIQTITLNVRSEWRRHLPIANIIDIINTSIEFGRLDPTGPIAPNLTINNQQTLLELLASL